MGIVINLTATKTEYFSPFKNYLAKTIPMFTSQRVIENNKSFYIDEDDYFETLEFIEKLSDQISDDYIHRRVRADYFLCGDYSDDKKDYVINVRYGIPDERAYFVGGIFRSLGLMLFRNLEVMYTNGGVLDCFEVSEALKKRYDTTKVKEECFRCSLDFNSMAPSKSLDAEINELMTLLVAATIGKEAKIIAEIGNDNIDFYINVLRERKRNDT